MRQQLIDQYLTQDDNLFIEVGAFDGVNWSPIVPLIELGRHGIMIEPNPVTFRKLEENRGANPKLTLVNAAASSEEGTGTLYEGGSLSTLKLDKLKLYNDLPAVEGWHVHMDENVKHACRITTLNALLLAAETAGLPCKPAVVSIDAEGSELDVLAGLDFARYRPKLFIIETHEGHPEQRLAEDFASIEAWMLAKGYQNIGCDYTNTIYWSGAK